jgi:prepilin-type N-terminal cleavage/methylation domain-containing protein
MAQVLYQEHAMMIRSCTMMRRNSGFTAFEVAITLAIMAVIATFVMPPYLKWLRAYRLRGATINLMADLEMAKIRAIRENAFVAVQLAANHYTIFVDNGEDGGIAGDFICNGGEIVLRDRPFPAGVSIDLAGLTLADKRTRFNGRGVPPDISLAETIPVVNSTDRKQIVINRLGYMNVQ